MATEEDWASYARAVIDIDTPGAGVLRLVPDAPGTTGDWPLGLVPPVIVVTAWNPDSILLPPGVNQARNKQLVAELDRTGATHWPAIGRDLESSHHEEGVAVQGRSESEGIALGARHGQAAIYVWTPEAWTVASCTDGRRHLSGWRLTGGPPAPA